METLEEDHVDALALLDEVTEPTKAQVNPWWRCKSCKTKKWKERAPKTIFKHAILCGFSEELCGRLRTGLEKAKLGDKVKEPLEREVPLKSILTPILIRVDERKEAELEPDDLEGLEVNPKLKRRLTQVDPVFHIPGKSESTLRADATARRRHIRILSDILYVSIQRRDWRRAKRSWGLLLRIPEVEWTDIWRVGLFLLNRGIDVDKREGSMDRIEWLKTMMRKVSYYRETILQELIIELILAEDFKEAKDQLNMYMTEYPFYDNATLRGLSGLLYLYNAQPRETTLKDWAGDDPPSSSDSSASDMEHEGEIRKGNSNEGAVIATKLNPAGGSATDSTQTPRPTGAPQTSEPLRLHLFKPSPLRTATRHFKAALRVDGRNTLAYGFLVLLGDGTIQRQRPASQSSSQRFSDSDSDEENSLPTPVLPLSVFGPPSSPSDTNEFAHHPRHAAGKGLEASSKIQEPKTEAESSQSRKSKVLDPTARHDPVYIDVPILNSPQLSPHAPNDNSNRRLPLLRDEFPRRSSSQNTSEVPAQPSKLVQSLETNNSEDDKRPGRRKKKARR